MGDFTLNFSNMRHLCYKLGKDEGQANEYCDAYDETAFKDFYLVDCYAHCDDEDKRAYVDRDLTKDNADKLLLWCRCARIGIVEAEHNEE